MSEKIIAIVLAVVASVAISVAVNTNSELERVKLDNVALVEQIDRAELDLNTFTYCHEQAHNMAIRAESLLVDLYDYGVDNEFARDLDSYMTQADTYNGECLQSNSPLGA